MRDLSVAFARAATRRSSSTASRSRWSKGETLALVGESGSGKIGDGAVARAAAALSGREPSLAARSCSRAGRAEDVATRELRAMRGAGITMVFQEPMTSLNPLHTIERQIGEIIALHGGRAAATARARRSRCSKRSASSIRPRGSAPIRISSRAASASA